MISLGGKAKDTVTGFEGIVVGITTWLNGCRRIGLQSPILKDGIPTDIVWIDEAQLLPAGETNVHEGEHINGGPTPTPKRNTDPGR